MQIDVTLYELYICIVNYLNLRRHIIIILTSGYVIYCVIYLFIYYGAPPTVIPYVLHRVSEKNTHSYYVDVFF